jgi:hypothetical protein
MSAGVWHLHLDIPWLRAAEVVVLIMPTPERSILDWACCGPAGLLLLPKHQHGPADGVA